MVRVFLSFANPVSYDRHPWSIGPASCVKPPAAAAYQEQIIVLHLRLLVAFSSDFLEGYFAMVTFYSSLHHVCLQL